MDKIKHRTVLVNDINMHIAEIGEGRPILFLHGFPELWYSWRHQLLYLSSQNYRCIAPDLRGYGDTDAPPGDANANYSVFHIVGDLVALLDYLGIDEVFLVGHDFGAIIAWYFCLFQPDRIKALVNMSVVYMTRTQFLKPTEGLKLVAGEDFYICRFQEPGVVEEEYSKVDTSLLLKSILTSHGSTSTIFPKGGLKFPPDFKIPLPPWLTEEDVDYYVSKYKKSGFTGPLNYYRALDFNWELGAPWTDAKLKVPVKFIVGDRDMALSFPGIRDYIDNGEFKRYVPLLEEVVFLEGVGHFCNQEKPDEVNQHILGYFNRF
ncbi:hypothetical protein Droror1_Dr00003681 [Drosera rotundifolia]